MIRTTLAATASILLMLLAAGCSESAAPAEASPAAAAPPASRPDEGPPPGRGPREATGDEQGDAVPGPTFEMPVEAEPPPIKFEPRSMDLGLLSEGESGTGSVKVRNVGPKPIRIVATRPSCACTFATDLRGTVIEPGQFVPLEATLTPKPGLGNKREEIRILAEGYKGYAAVDVRAEVVLAIRAVPPALEAYKVGLTGEVAVESLDGQPFRIIRAGGKPPQFKDFDPAVDAPRARYVLAWDLTEYTQQTMPWWWVVETDRPGTPLVDLRIQHEWTKIPKQPPPLWVRGDLRILGGVLRPGESAEFTTKLQYNPHGRADAGVPIVRAATGGIRAELVSHEVIDTNVLLTIRVTVPPRPPGLLFERIDVTSGGYTSPIWFIATVE